MRDQFTDRKGNTVKKPYGRQSRRRLSVYGIARRGNRILFVRPAWKDGLDLPGGGVEDGEDPIEGLKREFLEETGYSVDVPRSKPAAARKDAFYADDLDEYYDSTLLFFLVDITGAAALESVNREEIRKAEWRALDNLEGKNVHRLHLSAIREILE